MGNTLRSGARPPGALDQFSFADVDLADRFAASMSFPVVQGTVAVLCTTAAILSRALIDLVLPGAGPFALTFPFVLFATLFARWQAGAATMIFCAFYIWYFVLPSPHSFAFDTRADGPRVVVNLLSGFLVVAMAEYFRRMVRTALAERDHIAEERRLLLAEIDHRVKNNFAMVTATIRLESRRAPPEAQASLQAVHGRVDSIARAQAALHRGEDGVGRVSMKPYLTNLCNALEEAFLRQRGVTIDTRIDDVVLGRDRAVAVGLVVNELCTNAAKHAFPGRDDGRIAVSLERSPEDLVIRVADDGVGFPAGPPRQGSLGQRLVEAFAEQAGGRLERLDTARGTCFRLVLSA